MIRKFKLEDLDDFVPQEEQCIGSEWDKRTWIQYYISGVEIYTSYDDKGVIGFVAFVPDTMGNETICIMLSERKNDSFRDMFYFNEMVLKKRLAKRIQGFVKSGWSEGKYFALHFGFEYEGTLKNFGIDGEDYDVYAITRERIK